MKISISTKLIVVTIGILLAATVPIALQSSEFFEKSFTEREDSNNIASATSKAKEVEGIISYWVERGKTFASDLYKAHTSQQPQMMADFVNYLKKDKTIYNIEIFRVSGSSITSYISQTNTEFSNEVSPQLFKTLRSQEKFPLLTVAEGNVVIRNSTQPKMPPMATMGIPIKKDPITGKITEFALIELSLAPIQKPFNDKIPQTQYLIDQSGELIAHNNEQKAIARHVFKNHPFIEKSLLTKNPQYQTKFIDPDTGETFLGAAAKTPYGITVISQIPQSVILEPARAVKREAFKITGIAISISLFIIFLISMTLTSPIETLAEMIKIVSKGNFDVHARDKVKSRDEVGDLAIAFDQMTEGLKERDKVKNLFSKFHGSSVAEELLKNEIQVGGQNKEVVVFFSDIRGFTAFSEKRPPEEVVEMLNEYFALMVKIINQHGGVVDKFIGDAIMAIWGAPKSSDHDAHNAVRACIEMRKALEALNTSRESRGQPPIQIGMGLHAGRAISGNIGSDERMEYTVIGNTVNTASRIEASTKAFGADLLITEEVLAKTNGAYVVELAGAAEVKGRSDAIKMYKVRGYKENDQEVIIKTQWSDYAAEKADKVKVSA